MAIVHDQNEFVEVKHAVNYECDECHEGSMHMISYATSATSDAQMEILHKCDNCGHLQTFPIIYPYTHIDKLDMATFKQKLNEV